MPGSGASVNEPALPNQGPGDPVFEMRGLAAFVMRGPMQAGLVAAVSLVLSMLIPPVLWVAGAAVALYAMRKGLAGGLTTAGVAAIGTLLLLWLSLGQPFVGALLAFMLWIPVLCVAAILRVTVRLELSFWAAAGFGLVVILLLFAGNENPAAMWYEGLSAALAPERVQAELGIDPSQFDPDRWRELLARISEVMTGFSGAALSVNTLISLLLARWWQAMLYNPGGFGEEFRELRLGRAASGVALAVVAGAWFLQSALLLNLAVLVVAIYLFQGVAIVHGVSKERNLGRGWLIAMYVLLFFVFVQMAVLLAVFGMVDAWADVRRRLAAAPPS